MGSFILFSNIQLSEEVAATLKPRTPVSQPLIPDDSSSDDTTSSSNQSLPSPRPLLPVIIQPPPIMERQRRSFHLRLSQRAVSRSEVAQYEMFHVLGHLRVPQRTKQDSGSSSSTSRNGAVLVAVVKLFKETRVAELSLLEATRDEYITRHLIDGRFIYCDHRISVVSGYFPEEVSGLSAFKFMHKEDFLYTMIALRQMQGFTDERVQCEMLLKIEMKLYEAMALTVNSEAVAHDVANFRNTGCVPIPRNRPKGRAALAVISSVTYENIYNSKPKLMSFDIQLSTWGTKQPLYILDWCNVEATYNGMSSNLPITLVEGNGPSLLGIDRFTELGIKVQRILHVTESMFMETVEKFSTFEDNKLGEYIGPPVSLMDPSFQLLYIRYRPIPLALADDINREITRDEEGLAGLKEMRSRYSASVISSGRAALIDSATSNGMFPSPSSSDIPASPEDSNKAEEGSADPLDVAISQLISNLPQAAAEDTNDITSPLPDIQYVKVVHFSKTMPPPHLQAAKAGVYAPTPRYEKRMPGLDSPESVPPISPAPSTPDSASTASSGSQDRPTVITERPSVFSVNPMARPSAKSVCVPARTESVCVKSSGATTTVLKRAGSSADCDRISPAPKRPHTSYRIRKREQATTSSQVETEQSVWPKMSPEQQHRVIMSRSISPPETGGGHSYSPQHSDSPQGCVLLRSISPSETGQSYSTRCPSSPQGSVLLRSISPSETEQSYSTRHPSSPQGSGLLRSISPSGIGQSYSTRHSSSPQRSVLLRSISPSGIDQSYSTRCPSSPQGSVLLRSISPSGIGPSYSTRCPSSPQGSVLLRTISPSGIGPSYSTRCPSSPQGSVLLRSISPSGIGPSYSTRCPSSPQGSVLLRSISPSGIGPSYSTKCPSSPQGSVLLRSMSPSENGQSYSTRCPSSPQGSVMLKVNQTIVHSPAPSSPLTYPDFSGASHPLSPFHMMGGPDLLGYQSTAVLSPHTDSNSFSSLGMVDTDSTAPSDLIDMLAVNTDALRSGFILDVSDGR
uniref:PAS domain-containing protein n=1 Tax=Timema bartmani TaxID=61472 RepID=A0A7R9I5J2_9NEOP|nr:unnamed protein product [Timema bartmani]